MDIYYCPLHNFKHFTMSLYTIIHIIEIPTNKGANSYIHNISKKGNEDMEVY